MRGLIVVTATYQAQRRHHYSGGLERRGQVLILVQPLLLAYPIHSRSMDQQGNGCCWEYELGWLIRGETARSPSLASKDAELILPSESA